MSAADEAREGHVRSCPKPKRAGLKQGDVQHDPLEYHGARLGDPRRPSPPQADPLSQMPRKGARRVKSYHSYTTKLLVLSRNAKRWTVLSFVNVLMQ